MQSCGTYSEQDYEKVKKGINRKRRKDNDQWVPLRKKQKKKSSKARTEKDLNLVMSDETDDTLETTSANDVEGNEDDTSDQQPASIKPCTVRIENFSKTCKL